MVVTFLLRGLSPKLKGQLRTISAHLTTESNRSVSLNEVVLRACTAFVEGYRLEHPQWFREVRFTRTRVHDLVLDAIGNGCGDVETIQPYVNRGLTRTLNVDAIGAHVEDLLRAGIVVRERQGRAGQAEAQGNVSQSLLVIVKGKR